MTKKRWMTRLSVLFAVAVIVGLCVYPFLQMQNAALVGTDDEAIELIQEVAPGYEAWTDGVFLPLDEQAEGLLFTLQACIGTGIFCFCAGYFAAVKRHARKQDAKEQAE